MCRRPSEKPMAFFLSLVLVDANNLIESGLSVFR